MHYRNLLQQRTVVGNDRLRLSILLIMVMTARVWAQEAPNAASPSLFTSEEVQAYKPKGATQCFRQLCYDYNWPGRTLADLPLKFSNADPAALAEFSQKCNVDAVLLLAVPHHGFTTYPSQAGTTFPALAGKDWYGQCIKELHNRGISVLGYITLGTNWKFMRDNAGKAFIHSRVTPEGVVMNDSGLCFNAPGYLELVESYTREIMTRYPLDAIRYDMLFSPKQCLCDGCKAFYKELYGEELTTWNGIDARRAMDFYLETLKRPVNRLTQTARSIKPEVEIWQNHINPYSEADINLGRQQDIAYVEMGDPVRLLALRGILNKEAIIIGQTLTSPIRRQIMALGARCYQYVSADQTTVLPVDPAWLTDDLAPFFKMVSEVQPYLEGATLPSHIGIVFSENTRRRFPKFDRKPYMTVCGDITADYLKSSVPLRFINVLDLGRLELSKYRLLVLPETSGLTADQLDQLRAYAKNGGTVLVAGEALRYDEQGLARPDFDLAGEMGLRFRGIKSINGGDWKWRNTKTRGAKSAVNLSRPGERTLNLWPRGELKNEGLHTVVQTESVAGETLIMLKRGRESIPLVHVKPLGQGRIAYLASTDSEALTRRVMDMFAGPAPIAVSPADKQVVLTHQEKHNRYILHLLGDGDTTVKLDPEFVPVSRIAGKYPAEGWSAELKATEAELRIEVSGAAKDRLLVLE